MQVIKNEKVEQFVFENVSQDILDLKPIIAGGFPTAVYLHSKGIMTGSWNDIDFWFLEDHPIFEETSNVNFLINSEKVINAIKEDYSYKYKRYTSTLFNDIASHYAGDILQQETLQDLNNYNLQVQKCTSWANTFRDTNKHHIFQFIKKPYSSIEKLFNHFDFVNCCCAYYNGRLYLHDNFDEAYSYKVLTESNLNKNGFFLGKLWTGIRAFKYAERYNLDFSQPIFDFILNLYFDCEIIAQKHDLYTPRPLSFPPLTINLGNDIDFKDPYGRNGKITRDVLIKEINFFCSFFEAFTEMSLFNDHLYPFLIDSKNYHIANVIQENLNK